MSAPPPWEHRVHQTVVVGQFAALVIAIAVDLAAGGGSGASVLAAAIGTTYVLGSLATPPNWYRGRFGAETITLVGALFTIAAITLTAGPTSPYLLLSVGPSIFATVYGGFRAGLTTGLLSASLLALVTLARGMELIEAAPAMALYLVFVILVGVIRKVLEDIHQEAAELALDKAAATQRLSSLEEIHAVLMKLSEDVSSGRLNAIEIGAETLDAILTRLPNSTGKLKIKGELGLVTLAARGIPGPEGHTYELPITTADSSVGLMDLVTPEPLSDADREEVEAYLRPLGIAFANLQLLQDIAESAVVEERVRLAREMHDDIGPSLASLGLAIDMTVMQDDGSSEVVAGLRVLRTNVTKVVEDLRAKVADLRTIPGPTLTARVLQATSHLEGAPPIVVDIDERGPPRPAVIGDLTSIVAEAARNAHNHSRATRILIAGEIYRDWGTCYVKDDGVGFDPGREPDGHFGLMGMRERAEKIGATIEFDSRAGGGTTVTIEWGKR